LTRGPAPVRRPPPQHAGKPTLLLTPPRARAWPGRRCQPATRTRPAAINPLPELSHRATPTGDAAATTAGLTPPCTS
jgi:hypothetical protein